MSKSGSAAKQAARILGLLSAGLLAALATSAPASAACPNEAIRIEQGSTMLAQCRAFEMVTPVEKNNIDITPKYGQAAVSGERVSFLTEAVFGTPEGTSTSTRYLATRGTSGWSTRSIMPPQDVPDFFESTFAPANFQGLDDELTKGVFNSNGPALLPGAEEGVQNLYTRDLESGSFRLDSSGDVLLKPPFPPYRPFFADATPDFSKVLFVAAGQLAGTDAPATTLPKVYLSEPGGLSYVGEVPVAPAVACGGASPTNCVPVDASHVGAGTDPLESSPGAFIYTRESMSIDGQRIFFSAPEAGVNQLYVRLNGTETVRVSAPQASIADPNGEQPATFQAATPDGRFVFFTSGGKLTDDATTGPADEGSDLYRYEVDSGELLDISVDTEGSSPLGLDVAGALGVSDDGRIAYFVGTRFIEEGAGLVPRNTLYRWSPSGLEFLGLITGDGPEGNANVSSDWNPGIERNSRVTPDGMHMMLLSAQPLDGGPPHPDQEAFYMYDAATGDFTCMTCQPDGSVLPAIPSEPSFTSRDANVVGLPTQARARGLLANGNSAFFMTSASLLPADTNGINDVYAWTRGEGLSLISSGRTREPSIFLDSSADGRDVFIYTRSRLVGLDVDNQTDVYDARGDGGFPEAAPEQRPCVAEACQGGLQAAPGAQSVGSALVSAPPRKRSGKRRHSQKKHKATCRPKKHGTKCGKGKHRTKPKRSMRGHLTSSEGVAK